MNRGGRPAKWGEPTTPCTVRLPDSHRTLYEGLAAQQGLGFREWLVREMAALHGLEVPPLPADDGQQELPISA